MGAWPGGSQWRKTARNSRFPREAFLSTSTPSSRQFISSIVPPHSFHLSIFQCLRPEHQTPNHVECFQLFPSSQSLSGFSRVCISPKTTTRIHVRFSAIQADQLHILCDGYLCFCRRFFRHHVALSSARRAWGICQAARRGR